MLAKRIASQKPLFIGTLGGQIPDPIGTTHRTSLQRPHAVSW